MAVLEQLAGSKTTEVSKIDTPNAFIPRAAARAPQVGQQRTGLEKDIKNIFGIAESVYKDQLELSDDAAKRVALEDVIALQNGINGLMVEADKDPSIDRRETARQVGGLYGQIRKSFESSREQEAYDSAFELSATKLINESTTKLQLQQQDIDRKIILNKANSDMSQLGPNIISSKQLAVYRDSYRSAGRNPDEANNYLAGILVTRFETWLNANKSEYIHSDGTLKKDGNGETLYVKKFDDMFAVFGGRDFNDRTVDGILTNGNTNEAIANTLSKIVSESTKIVGKTKSEAKAERKSNFKAFLESRFYAGKEKIIGDTLYTMKDVEDVAAEARSTFGDLSASEKAMFDKAVDESGKHRNVSNYLKTYKIGDVDYIPYKDNKYFKEYTKSVFISALEDIGNGNKLSIDIITKGASSGLFSSELKDMSELITNGTPEQVSDSIQKYGDIFDNRHVRNNLSKTMKPESYVEYSIKLALAKQGIPSIDYNDEIKKKIKENLANPLDTEQERNIRTMQTLDSIDGNVHYRAYRNLIAAGYTNEAKKIFDASVADYKSGEEVKLDDNSLSLMKYSSEDKITTQTVPGYSEALNSFIRRGIREGNPAMYEQGQNNGFVVIPYGNEYIVRVKGAPYSSDMVVSKPKATPEELIEHESKLIPKYEFEKFEKESVGTITRERLNLR